MLDDALHDLIYGLHADCLEPGDSLAAQRAVDARPEAHDVWRALHRQGELVQPGPLPAIPTLSPRVSATLDAHTPTVLELTNVHDASAWRPVVFTEAFGLTQLLHPQQSGAFVRVSELPGAPPSLHLPPAPAHTTWRIVLVPHHTAFPDDGFEAVLLAADRGELPAWRVHPRQR